MKIGTHNSATGEKPLWYTAWSVPFARTQKKTIREQYEAGCRSFDIRVRKHRGEWRCAHGLFVTKRTALDILSEICSFEDRCQVAITYEGRIQTCEEFLAFQELSEYLRHRFAHIIWGGVAIKYGRDAKKLEVAYDYVLKPQKLYEGGVQGFFPLDGTNWQTYVLPIPWLWDKIKTKKHEFNNVNFILVDFL